MANRAEPLVASWLHQKGARLGLPIGGTFELTPRCNFNCPMCYVHLSAGEAEARGKELTAKKWIDLAREARDRGLVFALITGGEPFLRKDFFEIYHAMKELGLMISINTNGSLLEGAVREALLEEPPQRLNVSLYGGCPDTYRSMCGQDAFDRVVENIRAVRTAGVDVRINLSVTPWNLQDLARIYQISRELDVHIKAASYMYPPVRIDGSSVGGGQRLTPEEAAAMVEWDRLRFSEEEFLRRGERLCAMAAVEPAECGADPEAGVTCRAGSSSFWLTWDGRMLPCGMMPGPEAYPLRDGFGPAWETIRSATSRIRLSPACAACAKREVCGVCAAICMAETGSFDGVPEYACRQTDAMLQKTREVCGLLKRETMGEG